jgi:hypothetical protein
MAADLSTSASADFLVARDVVYGYEAKGAGDPAAGSGAA